MALYRDEGVVLRTAKLGEADRIITVLTRAHGKIRAVAKGVRRLKSRFGGRLEPFMRVDLLVAQGRSLDVISQAESISAYAAGISADFDAYEAGNVILETADKLVATENERAVGQYQLLIAALAALSRHAHEPHAIAASYVMRALSLAGWSPRLDACVVCGRPMGETLPVGRGGTDAGAGADDRPGHGLVGMGERVYLSIPAGGVMCSLDRTPEARRVENTALRQLAALMNGDWRILDAAETLDPVVSQLVEDWAEYYLERPLRSLRLMTR